jgi:prepilin peptidase CpaA
VVARKRLDVMNVPQIAALIVAVVACVVDLRTQRIPNVLTFGASAIALAYYVATAGFHGLGQSAAGWLVGAVVFIVPFALGGLGGGDVKLLAALGAWIGPRDALWLALYTGVAGGVLAVVVAVAHSYFRRAIRNVWLLLCHWQVTGLKTLPSLTLEGSTAPKLAYALPIFAGMVATVWLQ